MAREKTDTNEFGNCTLNGKVIYKRDGNPLKPGDITGGSSMFQVVEVGDRYCEDIRGRKERRRANAMARKKK